jgi:hypothetical protein
MMTTALSLWISWFARLTALVGSPVVSRVSSSSLRPLMPPALLISSIAYWTPWFSAMAADDSAPVSDDSQPILMVSCAWAASGSSVLHARAPAAASTRERTILLDITWSPAR